MNFLSVSLDPDVAVQVALKQCKIKNDFFQPKNAADTFQPVLVHLIFEPKYQLNCFELNTEEYSPFASTESQLVLRNQLKFEVLSQEHETVRTKDGQAHSGFLVVRLANMEDPRLYGASKVAPVIQFY